MTIENAIAKHGGQDLLPRVRALNASALRAARRAALDPNLPSRIRFIEESQANNYAKKSDGQIAKLADIGIFLFRPTLISEALSYVAAPSEPPDNELVRLFLQCARNLSRHNLGSPVAMLGLRIDDQAVIKKLTDSDLEKLQRNAALCFEPRISPVEGQSCTDKGWERPDLLREVICDLARARLRTRQTRPVSGSTLERA